MKRLPSTSQRIDTLLTPEVPSSPTTPQLARCAHGQASGPPMCLAARYAPEPPAAADLEPQRRPVAPPPAPFMGRPMCAAAAPCRVAVARRTSPCAFRAHGPPRPMDRPARLARAPCVPRRPGRLPAGERARHPGAHRRRARGARREPVPAIAEQLGISPHTVRNHLKSIYRKLEVQTQSDLIRFVRGLSPHGPGA